MKKTGKCYKFVCDECGGETETINYYLEEKYEYLPKGWVTFGKEVYFGRDGYRQVLYEGEGLFCSKNCLRLLWDRMTRIYFGAD